MEDYANKIYGLDRLDKPVKDTSWDVNVEGKLNPNNIIFHTNKYQRIVSKCKKYNDSLKKRLRE